METQENTRLRPWKRTLPGVVIKRGARGFCRLAGFRHSQTFRITSKSSHTQTLSFEKMWGCGAIPGGREPPKNG